MADFKLTSRMRIWIAVWLTGLVALALVAILTDIDDTLSGGALGAWCGIAIAVVMVVYERNKKQPADKLARDRYGKR
jgi:K+ transporter